MKTYPLGSVLLVGGRFGGEVCGMGGMLCLPVLMGVLMGGRRGGPSGEMQRQAAREAAAAAGSSK